MLFRSYVRNPARTLNAISRAMSVLRVKFTDLGQNTIVHSITHPMDYTDSAHYSNFNNDFEMCGSVNKKSSHEGVNISGESMDSELMILIK